MPPAEMNMATLDHRLAMRRIRSTPEAAAGPAAALRSTTAQQHIAEIRLEALYRGGARQRFGVERYSRDDAGGHVDQDPLTARTDLRSYQAGNDDVIARISDIGEFIVISGRFSAPYREVMVAVRTRTSVNPHRLATRLPRFTRSALVHR